MKRVLLLLAAAALVLLAAACGGKSGGGNTELDMHNFYFSPNTITGSPGQKVTLELKNQGSVTHNLTVPSEGINQDVPAGQTATVTVTIPQSGSTGFYCRFHHASGMTGTLAVSGSSGGGTTTTTSTTSTGY